MNFYSHIIAVGKMKSTSHFRVAYDEYSKRLKGSIELTEIEARTTKEEQSKILTKLNDNSPIIALDETGESLSSQRFADKITSIQQIKTGKIQFIIGGADGLNNEIRNKADLILSFGKLTWPHMLARVMLVEQIYRANLIMANHPYHREG